MPLFKHTSREYSDELKKAAEQNKNMKNAVKPPLAFAQPVKNHTEGVKTSAREYPQKKRQAEGAHNIFDRENGAPAHNKITRVGNDFVTVKINGGKNHADNAARSYTAKKNQSRHRIFVAQSCKQNRNISAVNQSVYGAVVENLHNFFRLNGAKSVVNA